MNGCMITWAANSVSLGAISSCTSSFGCTFLWCVTRSIFAGISNAGFIWKSRTNIELNKIELPSSKCQVLMVKTFNSLQTSPIDITHVIFTLTWRFEKETLKGEITFLFKSQMNQNQLVTLNLIDCQINDFENIQKLSNVEMTHPYCLLYRTTLALPKVFWDDPIRSYLSFNLL